MASKHQWPGGDWTSLHSWLDDLNRGQYTPKHTWLGRPDGNGIYSNAKASIKGNKAHNPFIYGPVTWALPVPDMSENTTITAVQFSFGTISVNDIDVKSPEVPELCTLLLLGLGLIPTVTGARKVRKI